MHAEFARLFDRALEVVASAPGRVNLLGEHTDYNGGFVLPTVIPQRTFVALAARNDQRVRVYSETLGTHAEFELGAETRASSFADYVQGVTRGLADRGQYVAGFDAFIRSTVPVGGGLSSSAALSVALLRGLRERFALPLEDLELARIAQWAENHWALAPVGILDPLACHLGSEQCALFIDTRNLVFERLALPDSVELVVVSSGVLHDHARGDYATRRAECERACALLGIGQLRELGPRDADRVAALPAPLDARVRHVTSENARVLEAVRCLKTGDTHELGALFRASHASMRDDYRVSVREVDELVEDAHAEPSVLGARLTGGGFGGAVVCLVERGHGREIGERLARGARTLLVPNPAS